MQKKYAQRGQELGNSGEATNVPTQRLAESLLLLLPPHLKDQTTTVILLNNFQIAMRAERDSMQHIFILNSFQIASVSRQFQKVKEDLKWKQNFTRNWKESVRSLCEWFRLVFTRSLRKVIWDGGDGVWKREKLTFHSEIFLLPPKGTSPLHNR